MKPTLISLFLFGAYSITLAQNIDPLWVRHEIAEGSTLYGSPFVMVDSSHNTIVCSNDFHPGTLNSFLTTKYDPDGNLLWKREYDSFGNDLLTAMAVDSAGSVYVGGNTIQNLVSGALQRFIVIKYAPNGDTLWNYRFDGPTVGVNYLSKLLIDSEQNLMVFGQYGDTVAHRNCLFSAKLSPDGQTLWSATYCDPIYDFSGTDVRWIGDRWVFWGLNTAATGYRYMAWQVDNNGLSMGTAISEFDPELFNVQYIDRLGNLYVGGNNKYKVTKYNLLGQKIWTYEKPLPPFSSSVPARLSCIESNEASEVFISGFVQVDSIGLQPLTTKLSASGDFHWEHSVEFNSLKAGGAYRNYWLNKDKLLIAGISYYNFSSNLYEIYLVLYDVNGFVHGGITDLEGNKNRPISFALDSTFLYLAGYAENDLITPNRQILCKYALSALVGTKTAPQTLGHLNLYPNPATDWLHIQIPEAAANKGLRQLELVNMAGKVLRSQAVAAQAAFADVSLEGLHGGVYVVIFKQNGLATHTEQVIKP